MTSQSILRALERERTRQKMTYYRLAQLAGGSPIGLERSLTGGRAVKLDTAVQVANALGVRLLVSRNNH